MGTTGLAAVLARRSDGRAAAVTLAVLAGLAVALAMAAVRDDRAGVLAPLRSAAEAGRTVELVDSNWTATRTCCRAGGASSRMPQSSP